MPRVYLESLGCPKNRVDSEIMLGLAHQEGAEIVTDPEVADLVVVNTCGFIDAAKRESINRIVSWAQWKAEAPHRRLIVTGCLVQRYGEELAEALPEVDAFLGTGDFLRLPELLQANSQRRTAIYRGAAHLLPDTNLPRLRTGDFFSAYLKVSEGCDHRCSFCIIPKIRGQHESRPLDSVLSEAEHLVREGVVEINLVAQDLTAYGRDRRDGTTLARLLRELAKIAGLQWIRLLYNYPRYVTDELLETIASEEKVCPYIDMPLQHASTRILRAMRRQRSGEELRRLLTRIRAAVPGVAIRTAFIVGFPGETDEDFRTLLDFVQEQRFERLGAFVYSQEEGTPAADLPEQVPAQIKRHRYRELMQTQAQISAEYQKSQIGKVLPVLVCGQDHRGRWFGRTPTQAPEIDGVVYLSNPAPVGRIVPVRIVGASTYDLRGTVLEADGVDSCVVGL
ncbi:MAG: 30S ribosomal protein S12 methylthiotransferase RimO [Candidatus Binatia bacterium]|nr:30S ribosomal protein S12 methylthiotransferase RimO [Candidatus Binatia bacterium]